MNLYLDGKLDLCCAPQSLAKDLFLDLKLVIVFRMLVVTSAAPGEVGARRFYSFRRGFNHSSQLGPNKTSLLFADRCLDSFAREDKRDEDGLLTPTRVGGQVAEPVTAIDQFFYRYLQEVILRRTTEICRQPPPMPKPIGN